MLCSIKFSSYDEPFELALVQWYDYKHKKTPNQFNKRDCPWIELTSQYEFVFIESIVEPVYIVLRFEKNNEYLVNVFMF